MYEDDKLYYINDKKAKIASDIISYFMSNPGIDFYGANISPQREDLIISIKTESLAPADDFKSVKIRELLEELSLLSFIPKKDYMIIRMKISDFFDVKDDDTSWFFDDLMDPNKM